MRNTSLCSLAIVLFALCAARPAAAGVIPLPRQMTPLDGEYRPGTNAVIEASSSDERNVASFLAAFLQRHGVQPAISADAHDQPVFRLSANARDASLGPEGYRLTIGSGGVTIAANGGPGLFYGLQTLEQLAITDSSGAVAFPAERVVDWPEYRWRGIHLDVSRHFFPVSTVKQYIDLAARYKLNTFHWHLTDDQGWRIEIKKYPRLATVGGCRDGTQVGGEGSTQVDGKRYCGFYTQDQLRDVVAYAKTRYITVVPEIEGPGHSTAAVSAYPWLTCDGKQYPVRELWGVSKSIMCPTERTFSFVNDVVGEVASIFPGPYIHIGGDEVPKDSWEASPAVTALMQREHLATYDAVQGYFTRRVEQIARAHGKRIVGWDEILDGGVSQTAVVMAWQGADRGALAAKHGNDVVMSPDGLVYLDATQGNKDFEPLSIGGLLTLQQVYEYDPMPAGLNPEQAAHVLGVQGNVWCEYIPTTSHLFYMLLPRELALAEIAWTPRSQMQWDDFQARAGAEMVALQQAQVPFRIPDVVFTVSSTGDVTFPEQQTVENEMRVSVARDAMFAVRMTEMVPNAVIHYTLNGSVATATSPVYNRPEVILSTPPTASRTSVVFSAVAVLPDGRTSAPAFLRVDLTGGPSAAAGAAQ